MILMLSKDKKSPIDFFIQECNPAEIKTVELTVSAYNRMKENADLRVVRRIRDEENWMRRDFIIRGRYYPLLEYWIKKKCNRFYITEIIYGDEYYEFKCKKTNEVFIDCV